jgi:hypothetical protein
MLTKKLDKNSVQNWSLSFSLLLTCKSFWEKNFSGYTFFKLKNLFKNIVKNIIWHLFAGESQQVVKITVTYWPHPFHPQLSAHFFQFTGLRNRSNWVSGSGLCNVRLFLKYSPLSRLEINVFTNSRFSWWSA